MDKVAIKIRQLLETHGKTQKDLAQFLGKKQSNMSHMLRFGTFDDRTLIKIAEFFKIHPTELIPHSAEQFMLPNEPDLDLASCIQQVRNLKILMNKQEELLRAKQETIEVLKQTLSK